jgi:magnesium chelatase family protein
MGLALVHSRAGVGVAAPAVIVEVHLGGGLPRMSMVGLPETAVREAKDRVKAALLNAGFTFPQVHITISLAPADLPKEGSRFDLPIALGILAASGQVPDDRFPEFEFVGELSLSGELNTVNGVLPVALQAKRAARGLVVPLGNGPEAALARGQNLYCASSLLSVVSWLHGRGTLPTAVEQAESATLHTKDLVDVIGQPFARRALEVAAAGGHNLLFNGPPGTGKTMLASRLPGILPPLSESEALEAASVASISQGGLDIRRWKSRNFRAPHHTASGIALVGGGSKPRPGEISLAHHGVLFLDELPEFSRHVLEVLREPMESGQIVISRAARYALFPARFQLVAAMNPCPCGYAGDQTGQCHCSGDQIQRYRARISGPLLDRIDLQIEVPRPPGLVMYSNGPRPEDSATVRGRVISARQIQLERSGVPNSQLNSRALRKYCTLDDPCRQLLESAARQLAFSPRACQRILKVARTLADLEGQDAIGKSQLAEAIAYRRLDMGRESPLYLPELPGKKSHTISIAGKIRDDMLKRSIVDTDAGKK